MSRALRGGRPPRPLRGASYRGSRGRVPGEQAGPDGALVPGREEGSSIAGALVTEKDHCHHGPASGRAAQEVDNSRHRGAVGCREAIPDEQDLSRLTDAAQHLFEHGGCRSYQRSLRVRAGPDDLDLRSLQALDVTQAESGAKSQRSRRRIDPLLQLGKGLSAASGCAAVDAAKSGDAHRRARRGQRARFERLSDRLDRRGRAARDQLGDYLSL